jgi:hypothetical protein
MTSVSWRNTAVRQRSDGAINSSLHPSWARRSAASTSVKPSGATRVMPSMLLGDHVPDQRRTTRVRGAFGPPRLRPARRLRDELR